MKQLIFLIFPLFLFSQSENEKPKLYTNTNLFEFYANKESNYSNLVVEKYRGVGLEINSFHGIFILKRFALSLGVGVSFTISDEYMSLPIVGDLKWYSDDYGNGSYLFINTGRNLKLGNFKAGQSSKMGIGTTIDSNEDIQYILEIYLKSKELTLNDKTNFNYQTTSIGVAFGIKF